MAEGDSSQHISGEPYSATLTGDVKQFGDNLFDAYGIVRPPFYMHKDNLRHAFATGMLPSVTKASATIRCSVEAGTVLSLQFQGEGIYAEEAHKLMYAGLSKIVHELNMLNTSVASNDNKGIIEQLE